MIPSSEGIEIFSSKEVREISGLRTPYAVLRVGVAWTVVVVKQISVQTANARKK